VIPSAPPLVAGLADTPSAVSSWTPPSTPVPALPVVRVAAPPPAVAQPVVPQPVVVGGKGQPAQVIQEKPPIYPAVAKHAGISGTVQVEVNVGADGRVTLARAISGPLALRVAAVDAVKSWTFKPASLNGRVVATTSFVEVNFQLASKASGR
jgi:TonB family protein